MVVGATADKFRCCKIKNHACRVKKQEIKCWTGSSPLPSHRRGRHPGATAVLEGQANEKLAAKRSPPLPNFLPRREFN